MGSWSWKIKNFLRKILPFTVAGLILYGGYHFYKKGIFRHGMKPAVFALLHKIPYFGSRFSHYGHGSYAYSGRHGYRHGRLHRHGRRGHRHHRRHR